MTNGSISGLKKFYKSHGLEGFDLYPLEVKKLLWDAHSSKIQYTPVCDLNIDRLRKTLAIAQQRSTEEIYGPDHPQSATAWMMREIDL